jgi:hypothetical protein
MHKSATKCNETLSKWCKNKHGASKIMDTLETYQPAKAKKENRFSQMTRAGWVMTHKYRGSQQSSREVKPKFIDSTQGEPKNICEP